MVRGWTVKASLLAAAALTVNALLLAPVRPVAVAVRPYSVASPVTRRSENTATPLTAATVVVPDSGPQAVLLRCEKVATPLTAATVVVPDSVPLAGLVPMASVMLVVAVVTVFPDASCTVTAPAGLIPLPADMLAG